MSKSDKIDLPKKLQQASEAEGKIMNCSSKSGLRRSAGRSSKAFVTVFLISIASSLTACRSKNIETVAISIDERTVIQAEEKAIQKCSEEKVLASRHSNSLPLYWLYRRAHTGLPIAFDNLATGHARIRIKNIWMV